MSGVRDHRKKKSETNDSEELEDEPDPLTRTQNFSHLKKTAETKDSEEMEDEPGPLTRTQNFSHLKKTAETKDSEEMEDETATESGDSKEKERDFKKALSPITGSKVRDPLKETAAGAVSVHEAFMGSGGGSGAGDYGNIKFVKDEEDKDTKVADGSDPLTYFLTSLQSSENLIKLYSNTSKFLVDCYNGKIHFPDKATPEILYDLLSGTTDVLKAGEAGTKLAATTNSFAKFGGAETQGAIQAGKSISSAAEITGSVSNFLSAVKAIIDGFSEGRKLWNLGEDADPLEKVEIQKKLVQHMTTLATSIFETGSNCRKAYDSINGLDAMEALPIIGNALGIFKGIIDFSFNGYTQFQEWEKSWTFVQRIEDLNKLWKANGGDDKDWQKYSLEQYKEVKRINIANKANIAKLGDDPGGKKKEKVEKKLSADQEELRAPGSADEDLELKNPKLKNQSEGTEIVDKQVEPPQATLTEEQLTILKDYEIFSELLRVSNIRMGTKGVELIDNATKIFGNAIALIPEAAAQIIGASIKTAGTVANLGTKAAMAATDHARNLAANPDAWGHTAAKKLGADPTKSDTGREAWKIEQVQNTVSRTLEIGQKISKQDADARIKLQDILKKERESLPIRIDHVKQIEGFLKDHDATKLFNGNAVSDLRSYQTLLDSFNIKEKDFEKLDGIKLQTRVYKALSVK